MAFVNTLDGLSLTASGISTLDEYDLGYAELSDSGAAKDAAGERLTDADYLPRTITFNLLFKSTTAALRDSLYNSVKAKLTQGGMGVLTFNTGGWTANRYYDVFKGRSRMETTLKTYEDSSFSRFATVTLVCKPFARTAAVDLPRNYVKDSSLNRCNAGVDGNGDYLPDGFTLLKNGTPTYSITQETDTDGVSWTKIAVTAGANTDYVGIEQAGIPIVAADVISKRIYFKCDAATGGVTYRADVYETAGAGAIAFSSLDGRTAVATAQEAKAENRTVSASTTSVSLRIWLYLSATGTGTLWVRNAMVVKAAALPTGKDGGTLCYGSEVTQSPGTLTIENVPGDVDAACLLQLGTTTAGTPGWQKIDVTDSTANTEYAGLSDAIDRGGMGSGYTWRAKIKFKTSASLTNCKVRIFEEETPGGTRHYLRDSATAATSETELSVTFTTAYTNTAHFIVQLYATAADAVGTLWVKEASVEFWIGDMWLPYWNNAMTIDSDSDGICDGFANDDSGTVTHTNSIDAALAGSDFFMLGNDTRVDGVAGQLLINFNDATDSACLGGKCSAAIPNAVEYELVSNALAAGRYLVIARMMTDSTTKTVDDFSLKQYQYNQTGVTASYQSNAVRPFTAASKWTVVNFGVLEIPSWASPSWKDFKNTLVLSSEGSAGSNFTIDYIHFLPVENYFRANPTEIVAHTIVSDTIDDYHQLYVVNETTGPVFPFAAGETASNNCVPLAQVHDTTSMTLACGSTVNTLLANVTRTAAAGDANEVQTLANAIVAMRIVARYLD